MNEELKREIMAFASVAYDNQIEPALLRNVDIETLRIQPQNAGSWGNVLVFLDRNSVEPPFFLIGQIGEHNVVAVRVIPPDTESE